MCQRPGQSTEPLWASVSWSVSGEAFPVSGVYYETVEAALICKVLMGARAFQMEARALWKMSGREEVDSTPHSRHLLCLIFSLTPELCSTDTFCKRSSSICRRDGTSNPAGGQLSSLDLMIWNQEAADVWCSDLEWTLPPHFPAW